MISHVFGIRSGFSVLESAHFIPFRVGQSTKLLADKYMREIVRLHGVPVSIMSDGDTRFRFSLLGEPSREFGDPFEV